MLRKKHFSPLPGFSNVHEERQLTMDRQPSLSLHLGLNGAGSRGGELGSRRVGGWVSTAATGPSLWGESPRDTAVDPSTHKAGGWEDQRWRKWSCWLTAVGLPLLGHMYEGPHPWPAEGGTPVNNTRRPPTSQDQAAPMFLCICICWESEFEASRGKFWFPTKKKGSSQVLCRRSAHALKAVPPRTAGCWPLR